MILFCGESLLGGSSEVARLLGQSSRQQKHCVEVLWSKDRKSTLVTPTFETFKKYFLDGKVGQTVILNWSSKKKIYIYDLYKCNMKKEKPCLMSLLLVYWGWGGVGGGCKFSPPPPKNILNDLIRKSKVRPVTGQEGPEGKRGGLRCSSNLSLTLVLDGGGSTPPPGRFTPGKENLFPTKLGAKEKLHTTNYQLRRSIAHL
jgi:hypothetical protein